MRRVAVVGPGGAGKTTFARALGAETGLDVVHLDTLFWRPGWVETPRDEWRAIQTGIVARDAWIIEGNYGATLDIRLSRADTVIFLDFPRTLCLRRAVVRAIRNHGQPTQAEGCPESFDVGFYRWIWNYPKQSRPLVLAAIDEHAKDARLFIPRRPAEAAALLDSLVRR
jgi:adenylate kinase family enzyme